MLNVWSTDKAPFQEKSAVFEDLITKLEKCVAETVTLRHDVQANQDCHLGEVDRAYNRGLEALESWKRKEVKDVEERHSKWFSVCDEGTKHLQIKIEEGKTLVARATQILSTPKAVFVRVGIDCYLKDHYIRQLLVS
ncbi:uncharacterized protein LOC135480919 [Liolophura sinensis]|uniref:uncharacterized protein LOC135480919 n=1 Tax=Liolophura sinensis TaxID=3198878 RepID=UPI00315823E5